MHLARTGLVAVIIFSAAAVLFSSAGYSQESIPVFNMTLTIEETGALHYKIVQTMPASRDGVTNARLELQKQYRPENVSIYDYATGKPLKYNLKEQENVLIYDVHFDRPYFTGYTFVVEYDNHNRIVEEGRGVYSIGYRPGVDINRVERISTVILPPKNFTYLDYNHALDKPVSVQNVDGRTIVQFRNISSAPAEYAWEIKFRAVGIKDELKTPKSGSPVAVPGMTAVISLITLIAAVRLIKK
ncbi:hypothetical protein [Methanocella arvoryzae]|uniref:Uncharacterized protein n=1 Tax=Methanocella arvoryzae (strain DSM 22066 / NBRC 105507 / MRE50) TaxID=351160 RepID=Q0W0H6_METAR|nr:hypothetical protein [Methanocella arvoryzae]CAJ38117.1 hypothetical protein RRC412 [Methanocella arvoryzae MRE50]